MFGMRLEDSLNFIRMLGIMRTSLILDMINIFEVFLPQLLRYPNPTDPLNGEAAAMLMREPASYETKVKG